MAPRKKRVMLVGPEINAKNASYGGGVGGCTRTMAMYLEGFRDEEFTIVPCFHTVRATGWSISNLLVVRMILDTSRLLYGLFRYRPEIVHVLAQYRRAMPREFAFALLSRLFLRKFLYQIKAGQFDSEFKRRGPLYRFMARSVLRMSHAIGVEGVHYQEFLQREFGMESTYTPNACLDSDVPESCGPRFEQDELNLLFVGYAYAGKGVYELVEGCCAAAKSGVQIRLCMAGKLADEFSEWLQDVQPPPSLTIECLGKVEHAIVLSRMRQADIFCLPTRHPGEGHNNSVNEALMHGCCVVVTRHGFLTDILDEDSCYFLEDCSPDAIAQCIQTIDQDRAGADRKRIQGHDHFRANYVASIVFGRLAQMYRRITQS